MPRHSLNEIHELISKLQDGSHSQQMETVQAAFEFLLGWSESIFNDMAKAFARMAEREREVATLQPHRPPKTS